MKPKVVQCYGEMNSPEHEMNERIYGVEHHRLSTIRGLTKEEAERVAHALSENREYMVQVEMPTKECETYITLSDEDPIVFRFYPLPLRDKDKKRGW